MCYKKKGCMQLGCVPVRVCQTWLVVVSPQTLSKVSLRRASASWSDAQPVNPFRGCGASVRLRLQGSKGPSWRFRLVFEHLSFVTFEFGELFREFKFR